MAKIEYLESVDLDGVEQWSWAERTVRDIHTNDDGVREGWIKLDGSRWAVSQVSRRMDHWIVIGELEIADDELTDTEYIVWVQLHDGQELLSEGNVCDTGFRWQSERMARLAAKQAATAQAEKAQRATAGNVVASVFLVPCPNGRMSRDEATWERIS